MGWLQEWLNETEAAASKKAAPIEPSESRKAKPEIKEVWFQIRPSHSGDMGAVEAAFYSVSDGALMMHDAKGMPTGKQFYLGPNDDPRMIAGRLGREVWLNAEGPTSDFNRPLHYSSAWIA
jgi:hypothetical protein